MTDAQKQKRRDYQKEYRKNVTDEQKQKYIKAIKIHPKKYTEKNIEKLKNDIEKISLINKNKSEEIIKDNIIKNIIQQKS